jgi:hypothetical protein
MPEKKERNPEIESDLFALTHTIINLSKKYKRGELKENFFQKSIKKVIIDLLKLHNRFREKNILLSELLENTNMTTNYYKALDIINEVSSLNFTKLSSHKNSNYPETISSSVLELPRITSEITSSFITILDAFKLQAFEDLNLLDKYFDELLKNIRKFPGLEKIEIQLNNISKYILHNKKKFLDNKNFRTIIENDLYTLFKKFQTSLNIQN